jgi:outer membrane receptor protein involved in Fe transport
LTSLTQCTGALSPNTAANNANLGATVLPFTPLLGCYDLTRTATLPLSDGCPSGQTTSGLYSYYGHTDIKETALYVQDSITVQNWSFNLGLRFDIYNGLASAKQAEPRLGIAYNIKPTNTVLRISYARTMESPFNENLIIASTGCSNPVILNFTPASSKPSENTWSSMASTFGSIRPGRSTSACWTTRQLRTRSSGPVRKSPDMPSA